MVGLLYIAALIIGLGTIGVQLLLAGDGDADGDAAGSHPADSDHGDAAVLTMFLSIRFWAFGLAGLGLTGSMLHYLHLASGRVTLMVAAAMGLGSGLLASWVLSALVRADTSSSAESRNPVGQIGKVLVPCERGGRGKVRIEIGGQSHDFLVTTEEEQLRAGELILVEEERESLLLVTHLPPELLPQKTDG